MHDKSLQPIVASKPFRSDQKAIRFGRTLHPWEYIAFAANQSVDTLRSGNDCGLVISADKSRLKPNLENTNATLKLNNHNYFVDERATRTTDNQVEDTL